MYELSSWELANLLPSSVTQVSPHTLVRGGGVLRAALESSLASFYASEIIAAAAAKLGIAVSMEDALSAALIRQTGFNLLIWNYQAVFLRIVRMNATQGEREGAFQRCFGVTPLGLAFEIGSRWNVSSAIGAALKADRNEVDVTEFPGRLRQITELADTIGKGMHPEVFPYSRASIDAELRELTGGLERADVEAEVRSLIHEHAREQKGQEPLESRIQILRERPLERIHYAGDGDGLTSLQELGAEVMSGFGIERGMICIEDADSDQFKLAVSIGEQAGDRQILRSLAKAAFSARESSVPVLESGTSTTGETMTRISSSFGSTASKGVLVIELRPNTDSDQDGVALFKTVRDRIEKHVSARLPAYAA